MEPPTNLLAGLVALVILAKANPRLAVIPLFLSLEGLAIAVGWAPAAKPAPQFRAERFLGPP